MLNSCHNTVLHDTIYSQLSTLYLLSPLCYSKKNKKYYKRPSDQAAEVTSCQMVGYLTDHVTMGVSQRVKSHCGQS